MWTELSLIRRARRWRGLLEGSPAAARVARSGQDLELEARTLLSVAFDFDGTRVRSILADGRPILGVYVQTGGVYLIGSADGSDAQGRSVSSVGGSGGYMHSDNPAAVPPPPFQLTFQRTGTGRLHFLARVGPAPINFATMSMPFDFGKDVMDHFSFNGSGYRVTSSGGALVHRTGSGGDYASIPQPFVIRDRNGNVLGRVGYAITDAAAGWAEVTGPAATSRVTVTRSSHYRETRFYHHFGTNNIELGLGSLAKGESAEVEGDILVTPKPFTPLTFKAADLYHQIGRPDGDGWSVRVGDAQERFLTYGPYTTNVAEGARAATFRLMLDNVSADNLRILTVDVFDSTTGRVLARRDLTRRQFASPFTYQDYSLAFTAPAGHRLEFRTFWWGYSYARESQVVVS